MAGVIWLIAKHGGDEAKLLPPLARQKRETLSSREQEDEGKNGLD